MRPTTRNKAPPSERTRLDAAPLCRLCCFLEPVPSDLESERAVLSVLLLGVSEPSVKDYVTEILTLDVEDFMLDVHCVLFASLKKAATKRVNCRRPENLIGWLTRDGVFEKLGRYAAAEIAEVAGAWCIRAYVPYYCWRIREMSRRRKQIVEGLRLIKEAYEGVRK